MSANAAINCVKMPCVQDICMVDDRCCSCIKLCSSKTAGLCQFVKGCDLYLLLAQHVPTHWHYTTVLSDRSFEYFSK